MSSKSVPCLEHSHRPCSSTELFSLFSLIVLISRHLHGFVSVSSTSFPAKQTSCDKPSVDFLPSTKPQQDIIRLSWLPRGPNNQLIVQVFFFSQITANSDRTDMKRAPDIYGPQRMNHDDFMTFLLAPRSKAKFPSGFNKY